MFDANFHESDVTTGDGGFELDKSLVSIEDREVMCRVRNVITNCLAPHSIYLYDTSVQYAYEASLDYEVVYLMCFSFSFKENSMQNVISTSFISKL